jgi:AraC-like DNA-binding protein
MLSTDGDGHRFLCQRGVRNYWFPIRVRQVTVGIAYLQALTEGNGGASAMQSPAHGEASVLDRVEFDRASRLLRLIVQHVQTLDLAELRQADLTNARRTVTALENEQDRLRKELERTVPAPARIPTPAMPETRAGQIVRRLLEDVQQNYTQPLTLQQCAADLAMNASYLSTLFSRAVGLPFKSYLTELRLARARELLSDPKRSVSEIAREVGYASENRFRSAFKKLCGLSPRSWRETFLPVKLIFLGWLMQNQEFVDSLGAFIA